jgi:hypothetical protein
LLAEIERMKATDSGKLKGKRSSHDVQTFSAYLAKIDLDRTTAQRAQRIGTLPGGRAAPRLRAVATTMRDCRTAPRVVMTTSGDGPGWSP